MGVQPQMDRMSEDTGGQRTDASYASHFKSQMSLKEGPLSACAINSINFAGPLRNTQWCSGKHISGPLVRDCTLEAARSPSTAEELGICFHAAHRAGPGSPCDWRSPLQQEPVRPTSNHTRLFCAPVLL